MHLSEHGPLQKATEQFIYERKDKWQVSASVFIGIILLAITAGALGYMIWDNYTKQKSLLNY